VPFVTEKRAALFRVHGRLISIGHGAFCLELHSAKARKLEVLQQLRASMEASMKFSQEGWKREAQRLASLRAALNDFVRALHRRHGNGLTVRGAMDSAIRYRQWTAAEMPWLTPDEHDEVALDALFELVRTIQSVTGELGRLTNHPLAMIQHTQWSNAWESKLLKESAAVHAAAKELQAAAVSLGVVLGFKLETASSALFDRIDGLVDVLLEAPQIPAAVIAHAGDPAVRARIETLRGHGERRHVQWAKLAGSYTPEIAGLDADRMTIDWRMACAAWWLKRWLAQRAITAQFIHCRKDGKRPESTEMAEVLAALRELRNEDKALSSLKDDATQILGPIYRGTDTDWRAVRRYEQWSKELEESVARFASTANAQVIVALNQRLRRLCVDQNAALQPEGALAVRLVSFRDKWRSLKEQMQAVAQTSAAGAALAGDERAAGLVSRLQSTVSAWHGAKRWLQLWCRWRELRSQALACGLGAIVTKLEADGIPAVDLENYTRFSYELWWLKGIVDREPVLRTFSSADHERKIREFREADERFQELTQQYIVAVLAGKVPRQQAGQKPDAELALVLRELAKQRAHLPVRKLVKGMPTLLPRLKPCLLMSPLSVAQYLDAEHSSFDVVVFDEASQIPVWDAVGAIARGKQLVVVGDPKQLPPTSFFSRADNEDESDSDVSEDAPVKDLESILDECLGAGLPTLRLEWHYRSRHESLITFSNHRYYESRLVTFPSPVTQDMAVRLEVVAGVYDRGGSRTNRVEADAIVRVIIAHFSDEGRRRLTLGIVTFNQPQQRLIETLLDQELASQPDVEQRITEHGPERLFIKNLENVQGDERDVILFSITYGKDAAGRMPMNFGPLNQEGGHRRLNVAITRARTGVVIFSSIRPEEIDLSRTRASGVVDLKNYLEFAARGPQALVEQSLPTGREPDSPFEMEVLGALRDKGWVVHPQVGCSGYRVDMAVVHPREPGRYVLGIECDGASYHSLPTARDRDRLRQLVLEGLGWKLHRIWSTDWWTDPQREMTKLEAALTAQAAASAG
jgi:very-short-patch-repair endonuclease